MNVMDSHSHIYSQEDHLRKLLDQRATRADLHGRFPSLSEVSDSPSIYSHAHFSPHPTAKQDPEANTSSFHFAIAPAHRRGPSSEPRSPMSDRERLRDPDASGLDLEDDLHSSYSSGDGHEDDDIPADDTVEDMPRLSMYGPKMRFHSRAPWELGEDEESEQDEPERLTSKPVKNRSDKADSHKKGWTLPRASVDTRPSVDSVRSQAKSKQSLDSPTSFSSNGGALLALAQASMSSTSLALNAPQSTLRDKLSLPRLRSRTPSSSNIPSETTEARLPSRSETASPMTRTTPLTSPADSDTFSNDTRSFLGRPSSRASSPHTPQHHEYTHPYANPDIRPVAYEDQRSSPRHMQNINVDLADAAIGRSESNATLTDSVTLSSFSQSRSTITLTPNSSVSLIQPLSSDGSPQNRVGVQGKGISAPIPLNKTVLHPITANMVSGATGCNPGSGANIHSSIRKDAKLHGVSGNGFPSWNENASSPSIKLISLEEAQAQARERSRSANGASDSPLGRISSQTQNTDTEQRGSISSSRARSSSASGAKARTAILSSMLEFERQSPTTHGDSPRQPFPTVGVPPKVIARKKSGFMRLFNAKDRERAMENWPPVPSISSDTVPSAFPTPQLPRSRHGSSHRVPVPSLSPSILADEASESASSNDSPPGATSRDRERARERQLSARRNVPDLSIVTHSPSLTLKSYPNPPLSAASEITRHGHLSTSTSSVLESHGPFNAVPNSAPPSAPDFVALSLRPVSSLFSPNLASHLVPPETMSPQDSRSSFDLCTPTTGTTAISPLSPEFASQVSGRASDDRSVAIAMDEHSSVVQALQDQINTARKAWQRQIWELEGQVRDLKTEVEELRAAEDSKEYCSACGRGNRPGFDGSEHIEELKKAGVKVGVVNRPRARTGIGSRFASGT